MIHEELWKKLQAANSADICLNSGASYNEEINAYKLQVLKNEYSIYPNEKKIEKVNKEDTTKLSFYFYLSIVQYLLNATTEPLAGEWVSEKGLTAGAFFFRGAHLIPTNKIIDKFGRDPEGFLKRGLELGATQFDSGDVGLQFNIFPNMFVRYVLWFADDEFPAKIVTLFDKNANKQMPLDSIWTMLCFIQELLIG